MSRVTLRNLGWAFFIGVVFMLSPASGGRIEASILPSLAVAAVAFAYLAMRRDRPGDPLPAPAAPPPAAARPPMLLWINLLLFCVAFLPTVRWLLARWSDGIWHNAHGLLIPFVCIYLARAILRRTPPQAPDTSLWGFAFVVAGLGLAVIDSGSQTYYLSTLGLVPCATGLCLLFLGTRRTKALALPLVLGLFMLPIPNAIAAGLHLPTLSAMGAEFLLERVGMLVVREETALVLPAGRVYYVREGCGGFPTLYAAASAALVFAVYCKSRLRRWALILAPLPLTFVVNCFRISTLVLLSEFRGSEILDTPLHAASGVGTLWLVMGMLFLLADRGRLREALT